MAVDRGVVGNVAANVMSELEDRFGDREDANARAVFLVVAVDHIDDNELHTEVRWGVSNGLPRHEAIGLIEYIKPYIYQ